MSVFRCDKLPLGTVSKTDEGFLMVNAPIAKVGVMDYVLKDGSIQSELVDEETLSNNDSKASIKLKPVTNTHPREIVVTKSTAKFRNVGAVGDTTFKDDALYADFSITHDDAIKAVGRGRKQLSPGYKVDLLEESGTFEGKSYSFIQRNRRYNHLALVDSARGGSELRLNIDHCDSEDGIQHFNNNDEESRNMDYRIDGIGYDTPAEVVNHIAKLGARIDKSDNELEAEKEKSSKAEARADSLEDKIKELEKVDNKEVISKAVKARIALEKTASKVLKEDSFSNISDVELMKMVIISKYPNSKPKLDEKDKVYVQARFDSIEETLGEDAFGDQQKIVKKRNGDNQSDNKNDSVSARERMIARRQETHEKRGE